MAETYEQAIKNFSTDEMARFLRDLEVTEFVPKKYHCDAMSCYDCEEDLSCFKQWLSKEVREVNE